MHWIVWALLTWLALSAVTAVVLGRVIRARDRHEAPPPIDSEDDGPPTTQTGKRSA